MKKKIISFLVALLSVSACALTISACETKNADYESRIAELESKIAAIEGKSTGQPSGNHGEASAEQEGTEGLEYYPLPDKSYAVGAGEGVYLETIVIPEKHNGKPVTRIVENGFKDTKNLNSIIIPNSVVSIGDYAFSGCGFRKIVVPNSVVSIGKEAFSQCYGLENVTIPDGIISIGRRAFNDCNKLNYNEFDNAYYLGNENNPYVALIKTYGKATSTIHSMTKTIGNYAFEGRTNLTKITIPKSVKNIGDNAFSGCVKLVEVCNDSALNIKAGSIDYGYVGCYAKNVYSSTYGKSKLSTVDDYVIYTDGEDKILISYVGNKTDLVLPEDFTDIYFGVFTGCVGLKSVIIPDNVKSIGEGAFEYCYSLTSVTIGNGVTSIGYSAFKGCSKLPSITIPNNVTSIGMYAFEGCSALNNVTFKNTKGWSIDGSSVNVTNTSQNAKNLTTYYDFTWNRI